MQRLVPYPHLGLALQPLMDFEFLLVQLRWNDQLAGAANILVAAAIALMLFRRRVRHWPSRGPDVRGFALHVSGGFPAYFCR